MKAVIMAGGEGTRLRPLTCNKPKPMVPVANKPVMEHIIELLQEHSIKDIAVTLQYMPQVIKDYFGDGKDRNVNLQYFVEDKPLGTAGSVKNAEDFLDETFIVISGDALTDVDIDKAVEFHRKKGAIATLVLKKVDIPLDYGVVVTNEEGRITKFLEKPSWSEVFSDTVNTGIYILSPEIFSYFQKGIFYDFSRDLFPELLRDGKPMYGYVTENYWCDIGDLRAYNQANIDTLNKSVSVKIPYKSAKPGIWIGNSSRISESAVIHQPVIIGNNCVIGDNAVIGPDCIIGDFCVIDAGVSIKKSVIIRNSCISKNCELRGAVICERVNIHEGVQIYENAIIGELTTINQNACIKPEVKIWPEKLIEEETTVNTNVVWGSRFKKSFFGNRGVCGELNVDITPEFVSKLAASYAATMKAGSRVVISCDGETASVMLKASMTAGVMSVGCGVIDFANTILSSERRYIKTCKAEGGIYISSSANGDSKINILLMDSKGLDIKKDFERKIETAFCREDFRRSRANEVRKLENKEPDIELYVQNALHMLGNRKIGAKIAYFTPLDFADEIIKKVLKETNCKGGRLFLESNINSEDRIIDSLRKMVLSKKYDIGVVFDRNFEKLIIIDKNGKEHRGENLRLLIVSALLASKKASTLVVPYNSTQLIDEMASKINTRVFRTKTSSQDIMRAIAEQTDESCELQLAVNFDAIFTLCFLLLTVKKLGISFEEFAEGLPTINMKVLEVSCPWNAKGKVIRELINEKNAQKECLEGVMLTSSQGRVLILPDAERPVCNIISEAATAEFADELSISYEEKVKRIAKG